jgi:hypothetical protein
MVRTNGTAQGKEAGMKPAGYVVVQPPPAHEGVGEALRVAYLSKPDNLPSDMARLLDRLNAI